MDFGVQYIVYCFASSAMLFHGAFFFETPMLLKVGQL
jgi:hypothetical protein